MTWELQHVGDINCTLDDSGVYTVINRIAKPYKVKGKDTGQTTVEVRCDLMRTYSGTDEPDEPIMSWQGTANNVRKAVVGFINNLPGVNPSLEHASYIGYELHRAETDPNYVQD